jgi:hypothetical protein
MLPKIERMRKILKHPYITFLYLTLHMDYKLNGRGEGQGDENCKECNVSVMN